MWLKHYKDLYSPAPGLKLKNNISVMINFGKSVWYIYVDNERIVTFMSIS
jgi:hypothetical protein